jgi:Transglycosylase SLT domain
MKGFSDLLSSIGQNISHVLGLDKPAVIKNVIQGKPWNQDIPMFGGDSAPIATVSATPTSFSDIQHTVTAPVQAMAGVPGFTTWNPPSDIADLIISTAQKHNINPALLAAGLQTESGINPNVQDNTSVLEDGTVTHDRGPAQINDYWNPNITEQQARDMTFATDFMAKRMADNYAKYGNWNHAVASYNVGSRVGPDPSRDANGLGPHGRDYLNAIVKNLGPDIITQLGLSSSY